jgi:hypothetical protein
MNTKYKLIELRAFCLQTKLQQAKLASFLTQTLENNRWIIATPMQKNNIMTKRQRKYLRITLNYSQAKLKKKHKR